MFKKILYAKTIKNTFSCFHLDGKTYSNPCSFDDALDDVSAGYTIYLLGDTYTASDGKVGVSDYNYFSKSI